jgi:hypothetical protein
VPFSAPPIRTKMFDEHGNLTMPWINWLRGLGSGAIGLPTFIDDETPFGVIDGVNKIYQLANIPNPQSSLKLFKNGQKLTSGIAYTLSGLTITYLGSPYILNPGDNHEASYRF